MNARASLYIRLAAGLGLASALLFAAAAGADNPKIQLTSAGQKAARAAVVQRPDFASASGWKGGRIKPDLSDNGPLCAGFDPKESDLVVIGAAESQWIHASGDRIMSEAQVMQTPAMVKLDWQRTMRPPLLSCLRSSLAKSLGEKGRIFSAKTLALPRLAPYLKEFRFVVGYAGSSRRVIADFILFGKGSTEVTMSMLALGSEQAIMQSVELHFVGAILSRIRT